MNKDELVDYDIALATEARAMFARLLTDEDKSRIALIRSTGDLVAFLRHTPGWGTAAKELPPSDLTAEQFSLHMERQLYSEYERLYRFAQASAKEFLIFLALRARCRAILATLRRLANPATKAYEDPLPPFFHALRGYDIDRITHAHNFRELAAAVGDGFYGETLNRMKPDPATGLPVYADAAMMLEERYYFVVNEFLLNRYVGPDKEGLLRSVAFKADMLSIGYILRLRRFNTPLEKAMEVISPIPGSLTEETARAILSAGDEGEVVGLVSRALKRWHLGEIESLDEQFLRTAEAAFFRKVMHGQPTISVAYAFIMLKEAECNMLKRVFVALQYGFYPEAYM